MSGYHVAGFSAVFFKVVITGGNFVQKLPVADF